MAGRHYITISNHLGDKAVIWQAEDAVIKFTEAGLAYNIQVRRIAKGKIANVHRTSMHAGTKAGKWSQKSSIE